LGPESISKNANAVLSLEVDWPKRLAIISLLVLFPLIIYRTKWSAWTKNVLSALSYILFMEAILLFYLPRVEQYTQHMAIEFFTEKSDERCYIENWGYKSYADLFYSKKQVDEKLPKPLDQALKEGLPLPLYIVTKVHRQEAFEEQYPEATLINKKGEFLFYVREAGQ
jgi:hypothetical protein